MSTCTNRESEMKFLSLKVLSCHPEFSPKIQLVFRFSQGFFFFLCSFPYTFVLYLLPVYSTRARLAISLAPPIYIWLLPPTFLPALVSALSSYTHKLVLFACPVMHGQCGDPTRREKDIRVQLSCGLCRRLEIRKFGIFKLDSARYMICQI